MIIDVDENDIKLRPSNNVYNYHVYYITIWLVGWLFCNDDYETITDDEC